MKTLMSRASHHKEMAFCYESSLKASRLAKDADAKLHILHLSTEDELALLDESKHITGEVCVSITFGLVMRIMTAWETLIKWNLAIKRALIGMPYGKR